MDSPQNITQTPTLPLSPIVPHIPYTGENPSFLNKLAAAFGTDEQAVVGYLNNHNPKIDFVGYKGKIYYGPNGFSDALIGSDGKVDTKKFEGGLNGGKFNEFTPGMLANFTSSLPVTLSSIAGAALGAPGGPAGMIAGGAVGGGLGSGEKQFIGSLLGVDPRPVISGSRAKELGIDTAIGGLSEAILPAAKGIKGLFKDSVSPVLAPSQLGQKLAGKLGQKVGQVAEYITPESSPLKSSLRTQNDKALQDILGNMDKNISNKGVELEYKDAAGNVLNAEPAPVGSPLNKIEPSLKNTFNADNNIEQQVFKQRYDEIKNEFASKKAVTNTPDDFKFNKNDLLKSLTSNKNKAILDESKSIYDNVIDQVKSLSADKKGLVDTDALMDLRKNINLPYDDDNVYREIASIRKSVNETVSDSLNKVDKDLGNKWLETNGEYGKYRDFAEPIERKFEKGMDDSGYQSLEKVFRPSNSQTLPHLKELGLSDFAGTENEYARALAAKMKQDIKPNTSINYDKLSDLVNKSKDFPYLKDLLEHNNAKTGSRGIIMEDLDTMENLANTPEYTKAAGTDLKSILDKVSNDGRTEKLIKYIGRKAALPFSSAAYDPINFGMNTASQEFANKMGITPNENSDNGEGVPLQQAAKDWTREKLGNFARQLADKLSK